MDMLYIYIYTVAFSTVYCIMYKITNIYNIPVVSCMFPKHSVGRVGCISVARFADPMIW